MPLVMGYPWLTWSHLHGSGLLLGKLREVDLMPHGDRLNQKQNLESLVSVPLDLQDGFAISIFC